MMRTKKRGFGMIEAVMALGILGGAGLMLSQMMSQAIKGQRRLAGGLDMDMKMWEVFNVFRRGESCSGSNNEVFKHSNNGVLNLAKYNSASHEVNWIGYEINGQTVKILEEGDRVGSREVTAIKLEAKKDASGTPIAALDNFPEAGKSTHEVELKIQTEISEGRPGGEKTLSLQIITQNNDSDIVGCAGLISASGGGNESPMEMIIAAEYYIQDSGTVPCFHSDGSYAPAWCRRNFNQFLKSSPHAQIVSGKLRLKAGHYFCDFYGYAYQSEHARLMLRGLPGGDAYGNLQHSEDTQYNSVALELQRDFELAVETDLELWQWVNNDGLHDAGTPMRGGPGYHARATCIRY